MRSTVETFLKQKLIPFAKKNWKLLVFVGVPALLIIISIIKPNGFDATKETVETAKVDTIKKTVLATGTVTSTVDLGLSFAGTGTVQSLNVSVGDVVRKGQVLASLNAQSELGSLLQAQAGLKSAEAALEKTREGATSEEVAVAEAALNSAILDLANTKRTQAILVANAKRNLLNSTLVAKSSNDTSTTAPTISGTYSLDNEGSLTINAYQTSSGGYFTFSGIASGTGTVSITTPQPIGTTGLFIQFASNVSYGGSNWIVTIPNLTAPDYLTNYNAYQSALETSNSALASAQALVDQRQAELALKKAAARPVDIAAKEADVLAAQGRVQTAQAQYEDKIIRAPADGTITQVNIKLGESPDVKKVAIVLQDVGDLYLEANVNEADVSDLVVGQAVTFTTDAFGPEEIFTGTLSHVDPAPTADGSIVNYKVKAQITTGLEKIKTGMTANMSILIHEKPNVVVIPSRVVTMTDGRASVLFVTNEKRGKTKVHDVTLGIAGDGGMVEVTSGLSAGDKILFKIK